MGQPQRMGSDIVSITNTDNNGAGNGEGQRVLRTPGVVRDFSVRPSSVHPSNDGAFGELRTTGEYPGTLADARIQEPKASVVREKAPEGPHIANPERAEEALARLEKVKANQGGFLKGLRERMGVAQEKMEAVAAKVGKALDAYNKLEPKTKLMIGLSSCAVGIALSAGGAPLLASLVGVVRLTTKVASTKLMYDGLSGMLDKKYAELGDVSETRKKIMKLGALATAGLVNFALPDAINNTLEATNAFSQLEHAAAWAGGLLNRETSAVSLEDSLGANEAIVADDKNYSNEQREAIAAYRNENYGHEGRHERGAATPLAREPISKPLAPPVIPAIEPSGFDAASAPPVGSIESVDRNGNLQGWTLPDGSFMKPDGTISAPGVQAITPDDWVDPVATGEKTVYGQTTTETPVVSDVVSDKFTLGVEESFVVSKEAPVSVTATPQGDGWGTSDGSQLVTSDGAPIQSGASAGTGSVTPDSKVNTFVKADAVVAENTITTTAPGNQISFAPNTTLSTQDMGNLSALNTITGTERFDTALTSAAKEIDSAKSFLSFGDGSDTIKNSFISVLQNNPSVSVNTLLTADPSNLSGREIASLKEAQGILKRIIPEDVLAQSSVRESSVVSVLQNNFTA